MDISLLKTFLEVAKTRHFGKAAGRLFLTQSAVSARIKMLESVLGVSLFDRRRNDIRLTPAGLRLAIHAESIVRGWERARHEIALGPEFLQTLALGCTIDLWNICVKGWSVQVRRERPQLTLQIELQPVDILLQKLVNGTLDLAFVFDPPQLPGLAKKQIAGIPLILVSSRPAVDPADALSHDYHMVDWGGAFALTQADYFPSLPAPKARLGSGTLALDLLLGAGGSAYLPEQLVREHLNEGLLFRVPGAPVVDRCAFAIYRTGAACEKTVEDVLDTI